MSSGSTPRILVVDDDSDIREIVCFLLEFEMNAEVLQAEDAEKAIEIINQPESMDLIICDYYMPKGNGSRVLKHVTENHPKIPYIHMSSNPPQDFEDLLSEKVAGFIEKPYIKKAPEIVKSVLNQIFPGKFVLHSEYCKIGIDLVGKLEGTRLDFYLKLSEQKYIKVFKNEDPVTSKDLENYKRKGVRYLYILKKDKEQVLSSILSAISIYAKSKKIDPAQSIHSIADTVEVVREVANQFGWSPSLELVIKENVKLTLKTLESTNDKELLALLEKLKKGPESYLPSHSTMLIFIACGIAENMAWDSEGTQYKISLAAMLHDLTLTDEEVVNVNELNQIAYTQRDALRNPNQINSEKLRKYLQHPEKASQIAAKFRDVPADVNTIIAQHHERPDGSGFPNRLTAPKISPLPTVFIVAEDLVDFIYENPDSTGIDQFFKTRGELYQSGVFKKAFNILKETYKKK